MDESGPCKLKRVDSAPGAFLTLANANGGAVATELSPTDILQTDSLNFVSKSTGNYTFSAFSLVHSASETWQLQFYMIRGSGVVSDDMPLMAEMPYCLGELPHEGGLCGLVPRWEGYGGAQTPGSQLRLRRPDNDNDPTHVVFENVNGRLAWRRGDFYFVPGHRGHVFQMHKLENLYDVGMTSLVQFENHAWYDDALTLKQPPPPEHQSEVTDKYVAEPWSPPPTAPRAPPNTPEPLTPLPRTREEVELAASDNLGAALLAGGVALVSACSAMAFGGSSAVCAKKKKPRRL